MPTPQATLRPVPTQPYVSTLHGLEVLPYCASVLWHARKALHLSRREVGLRLGLHRDTIRDFEVAHYWLSMPKVLHYAQVVGVPYAALFPPDPTALTPVEAHSVEAKIVQHLRAWPSAMRESLLAMLEYAPPALDCPLHQAPQE